MQYTETDRRLRRLRAEAHLIGNKYGVNVNYDKSAGTWLHIERMRIPPGWNRSTADILIDIPHNTPGYPQVAPEWFWTNWDIATSDGRSLDHFFKMGQHKVDEEHWKKGFGHFCLHLNDWKPFNGPLIERGDNLLKYLQIIIQVFNDRKTLAR